MYLKNKKILLITPTFYHYHTEIKKALIKAGAVVDFYPEMNYSSFYRVLSKLSFFKKYLKDKYINSLLNSIEDNDYDIVFVIRGGSLTSSNMVILKEKLPLANFIMYQWDSTRQNNYIQLIKYFDVVKTFDMVDSQKYNIEYLPLFYTDHYKKLATSKKDKKYDLVFYGAYHSDRLKIIKFFDNKLKSNNLTFKIHLYVTKLALLRLLVTGVISFHDLKYFKTYSVSFDDVINAYSQTTTVLDIELAIQNGLTIRTFETLGSNLKLITTNHNIKNESFYDSSRIMVIDRKNLNINLDFFNKENIINKEFEKFHIDSWLKKILL